MRMTVKEWIGVPSNPIQRDTERHLAKAEHLLTPHPSHAFVFAAQLPSGNLIKLDGHTRALAWERDMVEKPDHVYVNVIPVKNKAEAEEIYKTFDSKDALETVRDKTFGAYNRHNFAPVSPLLAAGNINVALKMAYGVLKGIAPNSIGRRHTKEKGKGSIGDQVARTDVYEMVSEFSYELHALDGFGLRVSAVPGAIIAAFILTMRRHGHKVTPFWAGVFGGEGSKSGREMDYIQACSELIARRRGASSGRNAVADLMARAMSAVEHWLKDETTTRLPNPMDVTDYLKGHEKPVERLIKAADVKKKAA